MRCIYQPLVNPQDPVYIRVYQRGKEDFYVSATICKNGRMVSVGSYETNDRDDAIGTSNHMAERGY